VERLGRLPAGDLPVSARHPLGGGSSIPVGAIAHEDQHLLIPADGRVTFGRAPETDIRLGHLPLFDELVPRQAGAVFAAQDRIVVANTNDRLALDVQVDNRAPFSLAPGSWFAPAEDEYEIHIHGTLGYTITVRRNSRSVGPARYGVAEPIRSGPPTGAAIELTPRQRAILEAYVEPVIAGGGAATHQQVAQKLHISRSLVRIECNKIWAALLLAGIPMRAFEDTRDQIVDAWTRHRF
jgi:hypothetical protein